jgi:hypothetical protein
VFSAFHSYAKLGVIDDASFGSSSTTPGNGYVTETGLVFYVAEDGVTYYVTES